MKVGILGSGDVGRALGRGFVSKGHDVMIGTGHSENPKLKAWLKEVGSKGSIGTFEASAKYGETLVLAILGSATEEVLDQAGIQNFAGKIVIDVTNPLDFSMKSGPSLFVGHTDSLGERIQKKLSETAKVVKCFNIVPNSQMVNPNLPGGPPDMLICGNDTMAKQKVIGILKEFGWNSAIDIGEIDGSRYLEALVIIWVRVGMALNTWNHAFKILRK